MPKAHAPRQEQARSGPGGARIVFLVALAVFAQESAWNFYDAQVPPLLKEHIASAALIGLIMGMDNFLGLFIQPWIGNLSDRTRTRRGRRMPFLLVGMPVAALLFVLIPHAPTLPLLVAAVFCFALVGNTFKPVAEALMPDYVSPRRRSEANAVVKIAIGLTVIVSALISIFLIDDHPALAFAVPAALMLASTTVLGLTVRDSESPGYRAALAADAARAETDRHPTVRESVRDIFADRDRSRVLLIVIIFLFAGAWAASRAHITTYGTQTLGLTRGEAGGLALPAGLVFLAAAYPVALLARRLGRVRVITGGMLLFVVSMVLGTGAGDATLTMVAMSVGAIGYAGFAVNAVVLLWDLAPSDELVGTYAGIYTLGSSSGAFLGPAIVGAMVDLTGWDLMLLDVAALAALAVIAALGLAAHRRRHALTPQEGL
ncbi:Na+/melibiose symporter-like transporter [Actinocorallia herbida]|uniref:Na+/melibiose symporter-like transporter n=1 Tax=Actinocorallia herbida TaxID=58109 RepID=A0A3N1D101_9ACTN|nr:MFS transporter [Actinocorallia herbida]ROO86738.1 Na+/melibiose symporter-like transporter [Actinocorallia herbida]